MQQALKIRKKKYLEIKTKKLENKSNHPSLVVLSRRYDASVKKATSLNSFDYFYS